VSANLTACGYAYIWNFVQLPCQIVSLQLSLYMYDVHKYYWKNVDGNKYQILEYSVDKYFIQVVSV